MAGGGGSQIQVLSARTSFIFFCPLRLGGRCLEILDSRRKALPLGAGRWGCGSWAGRVMFHTQSSRAVPRPLPDGETGGRGEQGPAPGRVAPLPAP